jgi:hypothetical protein
VRAEGTASNGCTTVSVTLVYEISMIAVGSSAYESAWLLYLEQSTSMASRRKQYEQCMLQFTVVSVRSCCVAYCCVLLER